MLFMTEDEIRETVRIAKETNDWRMKDTGEQMSDEDFLEMVLTSGRSQRRKHGMTEDEMADEVRKWRYNANE